MAKRRTTLSKKEERINRVYEFIRGYLLEEGFAPAIRDICEGCSIKSTSTVHAYLKELCQAGRIAYHTGKRRAITIPDLDFAADEENIPPEEPADPDDIIGYPLLGTVTAGVPIYAQEHIERVLKLSDDLFPSRHDVFVLEVSGDSMIDAAILDGDLVVVEKTSTAPLHSIVVGLIEDEATVKRLGKIDGHYYLFPENDAFEPIPFYREDCHILGRVIGVLRLDV